MDSIFSRLKEYIAHLGISNNEFGRNIDCSSAQVTQMLTYEKNFGIDKLLKIISRYPDLNSDWLLTGHGSMLRSSQVQSIPQPAMQSTVHQDSPNETAYIYKMYEKEKEENKALHKENADLREEIGNLKAQIGTQKEPQAPDHPPLAFDGGFIEDFTEAPSGGSTRDYAHMRKPTTTKKSSTSKT